MNIYDPKNNIMVINWLSKNCLDRDCYIPQIASRNENIEYVCGRRQLRGCPKKYIAEEKWNKNVDKYNQWDSLGQDEKDKLIQEIINDRL